MTILVTGANGFLGLNLVRHLVAVHPNAAIVAVDLHAEEGSEVLDIRDREACFELFRRVRPTYFVHAAAVTTIDDTAAAAEWMRAVNLDGTANVLDAAEAARSVERGVILSSGAVYGLSGDVPCGEDEPLDLAGAYACTKRSAELLMTQRESAGGFPIVAARIGPVYGPFERPRPTRRRTSLIHQLLEALRADRMVRIAGDNIHSDWTHARDVAAALDGLLFTEKLNHRIYNVSAGESISAWQVVALFEERGLKVCRTADARQADIVLDERKGRRPLSVERLRQDTGLLPRFNIRSGIQALIDGGNS